MKNVEGVCRSYENYFLMFYPPPPSGGCVINDPTTTVRHEKHEYPFPSRRPRRFCFRVRSFSYVLFFDKNFENQNRTLA